MQLRMKLGTRTRANLPADSAPCRNQPSETRCHPLHFLLSSVLSCPGSALHSILPFALKHPPFHGSKKKDIARTVEEQKQRRRLATPRLEVQPIHSWLAYGTWSSSTHQTLELLKLSLGCPRRDLLSTLQHLQGVAFCLLSRSQRLLMKRASCSSHQLHHHAVESPSNPPLTRRYQVNVCVSK